MPKAKNGDKHFLAKLLKLPITAPLRFGFIRRRVAFELRPWFGEYEFEIPLTEDLACPIGSWDAAHSFSEIFVSGEYDRFLDDIPLPRRWLDLGCHAGYFTLYLAWKNALAGRAKDWTALMIDADPRVEPQVSFLLKRNSLEQNATFKLGMIAPGTGEREFALRTGMGSSSDVNSAPSQSVCRVPCITAEEIAKTFPPPYDLIKIDIEGAEYDFAKSYPDLCRQAAHLLIEWHSRDREGTGESKMKDLCAANGFEYLNEIRQRREIHLDGVWHSSGVQLYRGNPA
ncbi:MAG: FkbM family methyltransferase [Chthoniobacteraceae bacterium]|jgi:FkbM family methyltransferase